MTTFEFDLNKTQINRLKKKGYTSFEGDSIMAYVLDGMVHSFKELCPIHSAAKVLYSVKTTMPNGVCFDLKAFKGIKAKDLKNLKCSYDGETTSIEGIGYFSEKICIGIVKKFPKKNKGTKIGSIKGGELKDLGKLVYSPTSRDDFWHSTESLNLNSMGLFASNRLSLMYNLDIKLPKEEDHAFIEKVVTQLCGKNDSLDIYFDDTESDKYVMVTFISKDYVIRNKTFKLGTGMPIEALEKYANKNIETNFTIDFKQLSEFLKSVDTECEISNGLLSNGETTFDLGIQIPNEYNLKVDQLKVIQGYIGNKTVQASVAIESIGYYDTIHISIPSENIYLMMQFEY